MNFARGVLLALWLVPETVVAVTLPGAYLRGTTDKPALDYKPGEEMVFTLRLEGLKGELPQGCRVKWFREGDDGKREEGVASVPVSEPMVYCTSLMCPGFVRLVAWVVDKDGKKVLNDDPRASDLSGGPLGFNGGAGVEPEKLTSYPEPADFDAFWNRRKAELALVPVKELAHVEVESGRPDVKQYAVTVACAGPRPVTGYLAVPSAAAQGRRFPALLDFEGYGERIPAPPLKPGNDVIRLRLNAFGYELVGKDERYYKDFFKSLIRGGQRYALSAADHPDPETAYFAGMSWRVMRALEYLRTLPEWDGKGLEVSGGSQAGLQSLWAAGLDRHVTTARIAFPWCCDMGGQAHYGRAKKTWGVEWTGAMGYYDPVNLAKRISCPVVLSRAGLGDYICPPSGIAVLWNNLRCKKTFTWMQEATHIYVPPEPRQTWVWKAEAQVATNITVRPVDDGRALRNPDCGWVMHYYDNGAKYGTSLATGDSMSWYPSCNIVYLRLPWSWLEPEEGVYNWQAIDTPAQQWIDRGGQISFRITVSETMQDGATPAWMLKSGAKIVRWNWVEGPKADGKYWECVPDDPIFLEKFGNFLKAFAARYDGRREVAFVDVGSLGIWGEGHTARTIRLTPEETDRIARLHTELHLKHFRRTPVVVGDDFTIGTRKTQTSPMMDWALAQGLAWRDDSIIVGNPNDPDYPDSDWWYHEKQGRAFSEKAPVVLEFGHYQTLKGWNNWNVEKLAEAVERHRASYLSIHGNPHEILRENKKVVEALARRVGYRFQVREVVYPSLVHANPDPLKARPFSVTFSVANAGAAPCYRDLFPCLTFKTPSGGIAAVLADAGFNLRSLPVGEQGKAEVRLHTASFALGRWNAPVIQPGEYDVFLSVGEADGTPVCELPMAADDGKRRYRIGRVSVGF